MRALLKPWLVLISFLLTAITLLINPLAAQADPSPSPQPTNPAQQVNAQQCKTDGGVWVIVQNKERTVATGCAKDPKSGSDALRQIGITISTVKSGLICELQGLPEGSCRKWQGYDKSTKEFWSYWHASGLDANWEFSDKGADNYQPAAGSVEGWLWGKGKEGPQMITEPIVPPAMPEQPANEMLPTIIVGVIVILALVALFIWRRRKSRQERESADDEDDDF